jgi:hypothetical protein
VFIDFANGTDTGEPKLPPSPRRVQVEYGRILELALLDIIFFLISLLCLFAAVVALLELGRHLGIRKRAKDPEGATKGLGSLEGAVFALLGLLIAFTFSGAADRFNHRQELIVHEANAIGKAYMRLDVLPAAAQPGLKEDFRRYIDARLAYYHKLSDPAGAEREFAEATEFQRIIWKNVVAASQQAGNPAVMTLVLTALNEMIDMTAVRSEALHSHPPLTIYIMLVGLVLAAALFAGYAMAESNDRSLMHVLGFALLMTAALYVIVDLEFPRRGLIRIDAADKILVDVRRNMN